MVFIGVLSWETRQFVISAREVWFCICYLIELSMVAVEAILKRALGFDKTKWKYQCMTR